MALAEILRLIGAVLFLVGSLLIGLTVFYRRPEAPPIGHQGGWTPPWRQRDWYRGPGYRLKLIGQIALWSAGVSFAVGSLLGWFSHL